MSPYEAYHAAVADAATERNFALGTITVAERRGALSQRGGVYQRVLVEWQRRHIIGLARAALTEKLRQIGVASVA